MKKIFIDFYFKIPLDFTGQVFFKKDLAANGNYSCLYCKDGQYHRDDGPAIFYFTTPKVRYCLNGTRYNSKEEWFEQLTPGQKVKALMNPENF